LLAFLRGAPDVLMALAAGLCARLERSKQLATGIALSGVQERVVSRLVALGRQDGPLQAEGLLIRNRPTQQELANQIGACRETVSRTVSELVRQGLLTPRGRSLLVSKRLVEGSA
jgi:CRP-like cAMP-binding protein